MVAFYNSRVNSSSVSNYDHANDILTKSVEELYEQIYTRVGEPMLMNFGIGESFEGYFEVFRERVLDNGGTVEDYQAIESMIRANWEKGNLLISYLKKSQAGWGTDADTSSSLPLVNSTGGISDVDLEKTMPMGNVVFLLDH